VLTVHVELSGHVEPVDEEVDDGRRQTTYDDTANCGRRAGDEEKSGLGWIGRRTVDVDR